MNWNFSFKLNELEDNESGYNKLHWMHFNYNIKGSTTEKTTVIENIDFTQFA